MATGFRPGGDDVGKDRASLCVSIQSCKCKNRVCGNQNSISFLSSGKEKFTGRKQWRNFTLINGSWVL